MGRKFVSTNRKMLIYNESVLSKLRRIQLIYIYPLQILLLKKKKIKNTGARYDTELPSVV